MTLESKKRWKMINKGGEEGLVETLLKQRGVETKREIETFLNPSLEDIPSYKKLHGANKAAKEILSSTEKNEKIYIHGDFDADGISSTALLWKFLYKDLAKHLGKSVDVLPYIPSRVDEGYGLSKSSLDSMLGDGAKLIITVDCGVRDRELVEKYIKEKKINIIVTDHHQPPEDISEVKYTVVHQMFPKKEYPEQTICGSAVVFLLIQAIKDLAGMDSKITAETEGLDLVGLATVTDMMPLIGVNRAFVKYGLQQMKKGSRLGLKYLFETSGVDLNVLESYHLGFVIGPRINAAGRIGDAMDALRLMVSDDPSLVKEGSAKLHNLNTLRQEETAKMMISAYEQIEEDIDSMLLFIVGQQWHEGIIGLVASKVFESRGRPTVVVTEAQNGEIKGSARSIVDFNITNALETNSQYLEKYGGHAQAAGFTVKEGQLEKFKEKLVKFANKNITPDLLVKELEVDYEIDAKDISKDLVSRVNELKPFGYGNNKPLFALTSVEVVEKFEMSGGKHLRLKIQKDGVTISCVMFGCDEDIEKINEGDIIDVVGYIDINSWNGNENVQMQVKEWRAS